MSTDGNIELVFIPFSDMGHILSTVKLAKSIIQINNRLSILIICLPSHSVKVNAYIDTQSRDNSYPTRLTLVKCASLSNPPDPSAPLSTVMERYKPLVRQVIEVRVKSGLSKPVGFVLDFFCTAMVDIANELRVPCYIFLTSGAGFLNFVLYAHSLADKHGLDDIATEFGKPGFSALVPGFKNPVTSEIIPGPFQDKKVMDDMLLNFTRRFGEMKGILVNTYVELELFAIQALWNRNADKMLRVYPVGPILELDDKCRGGSLNEEKESIMKWLDCQPESSVVFLCFGSMGTFEEEQVKEIANGLDRSGYRFLWTLRKPALDGKPLGPSSKNETFLEALPEGFVDRTIQKGRIIGWAPQIDVLAHPAIGGFVSHCGWNSILESLWFGVPIATWPIYAEQQMNAFTLVNELELAVEIRLDYKWKGRKGNFLVTAEEIEKGITKLMNMDEKMRGKVKKMSAQGKNALEGGGSSDHWLRQFIADVQLY